MIRMESELPVPGRPEIWQSVVLIRDLIPARRDKLATMLNNAGFILRDVNSKPVAVSEIVNNSGVYRIGV